MESVSVLLKRTELTILNEGKIKVPTGWNECYHHCYYFSAVATYNLVNQFCILRDGSWKRTRGVLDISREKQTPQLMQIQRATHPSMLLRVIKTHILRNEEARALRNNEKTRVGNTQDKFDLNPETCRNAGA